MHHDNHTHEKAHDKHAGHSISMFRDRFWVCLVLTVPVVVLSPTIQSLLGYSVPDFPGSRWVAPILGTVIFAYGGWVFITSAWGELRAALPGMMTLISIAIIAAYAYSISTTFWVTGSEFFWELATLITVMLFGHWMEMRSVSQTQGALKELAALLPDVAEVLRNGTPATIPLAQLKVDDVVLVRPGAKVPADGHVVEGESGVDESLITGESRPVGKSAGSTVIAGSINGSGSLKVQVGTVGEGTALAGIMRLVAQAQSSKSRTQLLADRAALVLTVVAIIGGAATFTVWLLISDVGTATERAVGLLVIACPHALGLAIPLVATISTALGARRGLLVRERQALELARNVDVVLFDKTGTLTAGKQGIADVLTASGIAERDLVRIAASVEADSEHHIGRTIVDEARKRGVELAPVRDFRSVAGQGVQATLDGRAVAVGSVGFLEACRVAVDPVLAGNAAEAAKQGKTVVYVCRDGATIGALTLADEVRPESREAVQALSKLGVRVAMVTGDAREVAESVAKELGITEVFAEVRPDDKANKVRQLQRDGSRVAMVGDGVNDAPALAAADVGIAIGAGTDVAIESAGIVLTRNDPRDVVRIINLSRATYRKMVQNLVWATGYNVVAIPLAAGVLAGFGILLAPALGALFMSVSTVVVALNAQLLRRTAT